MALNGQEELYVSSGGAGQVTVTVDQIVAQTNNPIVSVALDGGDLVFTHLDGAETTITLPA